MATKKPAFIALNRHDNNYFKGSLDDIMSEMEDYDADPEDYEFHRADEVQVKFVKKLTLGVDDGNS